MVGYDKSHYCVLHYHLLLHREVCGNGTLVTLQNDVEARGMTYTCDDNPDSVMYLLCAEKPDCRECKLAKALASGQLSYNSTVITPDYIMG
ncbi:ADP-ribosyl cyclase/cyclic ADP-ribose hydrolase [Biomphalaria glabrata]